MVFSIIDNGPYCKCPIDKQAYKVLVHRLDCPAQQHSNNAWNHIPLPKDITCVLWNIFSNNNNRALCDPRPDTTNVNDFLGAGETFKPDFYIHERSGGIIVRLIRRSTTLHGGCDVIEIAFDFYSPLTPSHKTGRLVNYFYNCGIDTPFPCNDAP
jgi:hypothetical protein